MSQPLDLTIACGDYPYTRPLKDGSVGIPGCTLTFAQLKPGEMFARAFDDPQFNVAELSLANYVSRRLAGNSDYVMFPAYVFRSFRQDNLYVRKDRSVRTPQELRGRRVGVGGYNHTAFTWLRGLLQDEYEVTPSQIQWVSMSHDPAFRTPPGVSIEWADGKKTLLEMLEDGEIDALAAAHAPASSKIVRLIENVEAAEADYYRRTGILPILHVMGVRLSLLEQHPWLPGKLYRAFVQAKELAFAKREKPSDLTDHEQRMRKLIGSDYLPYGIGERERKTLERLLDYHYDQGLGPRRYGLEELFAPVPLSEYAD